MRRRRGVGFSGAQKKAGRKSQRSGSGLLNGSQRGFPRLGSEIQTAADTPDPQAQTGVWQVHFAVTVDESSRGLASAPGAPALVFPVSNRRLAL